MWIHSITSFLQWLRFEKRCSPHTIGAYERDLKQFSAFLTKEYNGLDNPGEIKAYHFRSWLAGIQAGKKPVGPATINRKISALQSFYKYLLREGSITKNPAGQLHSLRLPERLPQFLKESETEILLEEKSFGEGFTACTDRLICELLYSTGIRRGELINIRETDIEWSLRQLRVLGKGNKERLIPLGEAVLDDLRAYLAEKRKTLEASETTHLLLLESGKPLYPVYVDRVMKKHLAGISTLEQKSPHVMRHTFATHLLDNGANIQAIKELLGHSSLAATQVYTHNTIGKLKNVHRDFHPREKGGK